MKNGKKPTYGQRKTIQQNGLNSQEWLVSKDTPNSMVLVHRNNQQIIKTIIKAR